MALNPTARATARRNVSHRIDRFLNILQRTRRQPNRRELFWLRHALVNLHEDHDVGLKQACGRSVVGVADYGRHGSL